MLTEEQLSERLRAGLHRDLAAINPPDDLLERLRIQPIEERALHASRSGADKSRPRRSARITVGGLAGVFGVVVALAIAGLAVVLIGHHRASPNRPPATSTPSSVSSRQPPTLKQLLARFRVLRRPQVSADRWHQARTASFVRPISQLTRLATPLSNGDRVFLTVDRFLRAEGDHPPGSYLMIVWLVDGRGRAIVSAPYSSLDDYTTIPSALPVIGRSLSNRPVYWIGVVPDGVARVRWTFTCTSSSGDCGSFRGPVTVSVPPISNVVEAQPPTASGCHEPYCRVTKATWYASNGHVIRSFNIEPQLARAQQGQERAIAQTARRPIAPSLLAHFRLFRLPKATVGGPNAPALPLNPAVGYVDQQGYSLNVEQARFIPLRGTPPSSNGLPHGIWVIPGSDGLCLQDTNNGSGCGTLIGPGSPDSGRDVMTTTDNGMEWVIGIAPDGNKTVSVVLSNGTVKTVPVIDNAYAVAINGRAVKLISKNAAGHTTSMPL